MFGVICDGGISAIRVGGGSGDHDREFDHLQYGYLDTIPPVILCPSNRVVECAGPSGTPVTWSASAQDSCWGPVAVTCVPLSGSLFPLGTTNVYCGAVDSSGNSNFCSFTVTVIDTTLPVLTLAGANPLSVECHSVFTDPGVTATDACAGTLSVTVSGSVDTNTPGSYTLTYTATDSSTNTAATNRTVTVVDTTPPVIPLAGANPLTVECHTLFTDPGATAMDACAGTLPVTVTGSVDANTVGSYTLTYTATDSYANTTTTNRTATVVDTTPPVIVCPTDMVVFATRPDGVVANFSVSASDACDAAPTVAYSHPPGTVFSPGTNTVICTATDSSGNVATCSFTVAVRLPDYGDTPYSSTYHTLFADNGARHATRKPYFGSAVPGAADRDGEPDASPNLNADGDDTYDGNDDEQGIRFFDPLVAGTTVRIEINAPLGGQVDAWLDFNADRDWTDPGEQIMTNLAVSPGVFVYPVAMPAGAAVGTNTYARFRISTAGGVPYDGPAPDGEVEDYRTDLLCAPPQLTCPSGVSVLASNRIGAVVQFTVTVVSRCDPVPTVECTPPPGSLFPVGTTVVTCTATDFTGNRSTCEFPVSVRELEITQRGTIPQVRWEVGDAVLEQADAVTGPWTEVPGAASPYPVVNLQAGKFYRLRFVR